MVLFTSTDGGAVWSQNFFSMSSESACALETCPQVPGLLLFGGGHPSYSILRSTDEGGSWTTVLNAWPGTVSAIEQDPFDTAHIVAARVSSNSTTFYHSHDYGQTWQESPDLLNGMSVMHIQFSSEMPGRYLCATEDGVLLTDDGENFTEVLDQTTWRLESDPNRPGEVYAACGTAGVYSSADDGLTWESMPPLYRDGIPVRAVELAGTAWLYAGTQSFGTFRINLESMDVTQPVSGVQEQGVRVAATPVSGSVTLILPPSSQSVSLQVYDLAGRVVSSKALPPSSAPRSLVVDGLLPGVYFAGVSTGEPASRFVVVR
jgi:hypothetical protein